MGTITWPLSWLLLLALATLVAMVTVVGSSELWILPQAKRFCDVHVRPRGYDCEEHKLYTDDGYMLLLHRVVLRGNLQKTVRKWLAPKILKFGGPSSVSNSGESAPSTSPRSYGMSMVEAPESPQSFSTPNTIARTHETSPATAATCSGSFGARSPRRGSHKTLPPGAPGSFAPRPRAGSHRRSPATAPGSSDSSGGSAPSPGTGRHGRSVAGQPEISNTFGVSAPSRTGSYGTSPSGAPGNCTSIGDSAQSSSTSYSGAWAPAIKEHDYYQHDRKSGSKIYCNPVLLMHPEMQNGASWFQTVNPGRDTLLPLTLADQGFDVWVGHERATFWSHDHLKLSVYEDAYWNFTWDEHVRYDVPKMLTYISNMTAAKVHYVGVSLSATVGAAAATNPSVADLLQSLTLLAPAIYLGGNTAGIQALTEFFSRVGFIYPLPANRRGAFNFGREFHVRELPLIGPASLLRFAISGPDCCLGPAVIPLDNGWDGVTSFKTIRHIQQAISTDKFQHFDYGSAVLNALAYNGSTTPPMYHSKNIPADLPILVIYGGQDNFVPPTGVLDFMASMQTRPNAVYLPYYAHLDLTMSVRRADDVYGPIEAFLRDEHGADKPYN